MYKTKGYIHARACTRTHTHTHTHTRAHTHTYIWITCTLTKCMEKKLDGNCTRMLRAMWNKSCRQHLTK